MNTSETIEKWLLKSIKQFRSMSFFERQRELTDHELAIEILAWREERWGERFDPTNIFSELSLLSWDEDRVWWNDTEADVVSGRSTYKKTIQEWSYISRGAFLPSDIQEYWETEDGPIKISFSHNDQFITLHPDYLEDYIDLGLLRQINALINNTGLQFELYKPFDQTGFVVVLNVVEKNRLITERGWQFTRGISNL